MKKIVYSFGLLVSLIWMSCANIATLTGGEKDELAPQLKSRNISDSVLNFKGGKIEFEFDEFVQLKDIQNQLVITPLMKTKPNIKFHKRKVSIDISDSLLESNTTYHLSLGNGIADIHESNVVQNVSFTFSTGNYFDSLSLTGNVNEARTGKEDTNVWIVLYPASLPDSAFSKQLPMYLQKSNHGSFEFKNLPNKDFHIYALQDLNNNLKYDVPEEKVAFYKSTINPSSLKEALQLYTFATTIASDSNKNQQLRGKSAKPLKNSILNYQVNIDTNKKNERSFDIKDSIKISFVSPLLKYEQSKIRLYQADVLDATANISIDSSKKILSINTEWLPESNYSLKLLKGFAQDSNENISNANEFTFKTKRATDYGILSVHLPQNSQDWAELFQGEKMIGRKKIADSIIQFQYLNPGVYQLRILHDQNTNEQWDAGNLYDHKLPEVVELLPNEIQIKANWENKLNFKQERKSKK